MTAAEPPTPPPRRGLTRRSVLLAGGGAAVGLAAGAAGGYATGHAAEPAPDEPADTVPFEGEHQAGVATPAQARLVFGAFDLVSERPQDLRDLLRTWTQAARRMTVGRPVGPVAGDPASPPVDTGEAMGLPASRLTITVGLGPGVFERDGEDRMGLRARRPSKLVELPPLPGDQLDPGRTGGDVCVQACADDPQVAFHAVRDLLRVGRGTVDMRWIQLGFAGNTRTTTEGPTPRNLMGFKDGTRNLRVDDPEQMKRFVWVGPDEPQAWFRGGTYVVARRIRMLIEAWDRDYLADQENVFGRTKVTGAPLGGRDEFDTPDLEATGADGQPVIPVDAHIRLAAPETNDDQAILRRGYAYTDGIDARTGLLDAGLFFVAFQSDPERQFIAIQRRLGTADALNEYIQHTGGGLYAVLPGVARGGYLGDSLFAATG
ncbi:MAG: iron uptake transporter deferrochelatase/peroxidase subunit [Solirubrobacteraceae bacterium]